MKQTITRLGTKCEIPIPILRNVTLPEMPARFDVAFLNNLHKERYIPPTEVIGNEIGVTPPRAIQLENVLLNEGLLVGDRRKRTLMVRWDAFADRRCVENFLHHVRHEKHGNRKYLHTLYSKSEIAELGYRFKEETGIDRTDICAQIETLRKKGYLREDGDYLVVNQEKLLKQSLVLKEINEKGLEEYDLPQRHVFDIGNSRPLTESFLEWLYRYEELRKQGLSMNEAAEIIADDFQSEMFRDIYTNLRSRKKGAYLRLKYAPTDVVAQKLEGLRDGLNVKKKT